MTGQVSNTKRWLAISLMVLIVIISVAGSVLLVLNYKYVKVLESSGLLGLFLISVFAGSPIPIPSPNMILTFTMGSIFNPALVGFVSGLGNAIGNALVYLTGRGGLLFFQNLGITRKAQGDNDRPSLFNRIINKLRMNKLREFARKRVLLAVFILGMYPNPVLMAIVMGMGASRYNFWKFFVVCWAGKTVESMVLSYLGYFGLRSILRYFGIEMP